MTDPTVANFYNKNPEEGYINTYDDQHGPRLDAMIAHYGLSDLKNQAIADIGGGLGFLGKRLDPSNKYWVFDGAEIPEKERLCHGFWTQTDIQRDHFGGYAYTKDMSQAVNDDTIFLKPSFDIAFCLETLEHLSDPYHCLTEIKQMVKPGGNIIMSIPTETVWHNTVYPGLLWPRQNWEQFLGQMALPILDFWTFEPKPNGGWPAYHYRCFNAGWEASKMLFPKTEAKFQRITPLQSTNL